MLERAPVHVGLEWRMSEHCSSILYLERHQNLWLVVTFEDLGFCFSLHTVRTELLVERSNFNVPLGKLLFHGKESLSIFPIGVLGLALVSTCSAESLRSLTKALESLAFWEGSGRLGSGSPLVVWSGDSDSDLNFWILVGKRETTSKLLDPNQRTREADWGLRGCWGYHLGHNQNPGIWREIRDNPSHKWLRTSAFSCSPLLYQVLLFFYFCTRF